MVGFSVDGALQHICEYITLSPQFFSVRVLAMISREKRDIEQH